MAQPGLQRNRNQCSSWHRCILCRNSILTPLPALQSQFIRGDPLPSREEWAKPPKEIIPSSQRFHDTLGAFHWMKILVWIFGNLRWRMQQHFFGISGKEDNIARKVYRNFREFFTGKFPKFSLEWFAFRKFNSFQIFRKHFQKFPCHLFPPRNCRNFWINRKPRPPLLPSFSATVPQLVFVAVVAV